jgi:hypothetical protein
MHGPAWPCRCGVRFFEGADEWLPWFAETKTHLSVHIVGMELNFNGLPNDAIHVLGRSGEDRSIMKFDAVSEVDAVFSHGWILWMFKTDVLLMFLQPCVYGTACLPNVDLAALTGVSVLSSRLSLTNRRKPDTFLGGRPTDLMLCQDSTLLIQLNIVLT